jgi:hypothetical protein
VGAEKGDLWLEQCARSPQFVWPTNLSVPAHLADTLKTLGFDAAIDELLRHDSAGLVVGRLVGILLETGPARRMTLANKIVSRAADPSVGAFTVPAELADLGARLAVAMSPSVEDESAPSARVGFDPCVGCGEMLAGLARLATPFIDALDVHGYTRSAETLAIARTSVALSGVSPDRLSLGEWLAKPLRAAPDFQYLVSAIEAMPWRHLEPWLANECAFPAWPRSSDSSLLYLAAIARCISERPQSVAVVLVNSAALTVGLAGSGDVRLRRFIVETGLLHAVVTLPGGLLERTSLAPTLVVLRRASPGSNSGSFRLVDARDRGEPADRRRLSLSPREIERIVNALSDVDGVVCRVVPASLLAEDGRWRIPPLSHSLRETATEVDGAVQEERLGDLCEILPGRTGSRRAVPMCPANGSCGPKT